MDPELLKRAHDFLLRAGSLEKLRDVFSQEPVLLEPEFHQALLRSIEYGPPENVRYAYEGLFFLLHGRAHRRRAEQCSNEAQTFQAFTPVYAPAYFLQLSQQLDGRIPPRRDRVLSPALDAALLQEDLHKVLGSKAHLPAYAPTPGTSWCAVVVTCAACGRERLELKAQFIDLKVAPQLVEPLRAGHIHSARCRCGCNISLPEHVWLHEGPLPHDNLQAVCCLWALDESVLVFELPPGTPEDPKLKPVLIGRMQHLARLLGFEDRGKATSSIIMVLAFKQDVLLSEIDKLSGVDAADHLFEVTVDFLAHQLEQGASSFEDALFIADRLVAERGQTWTASLTFETHDAGGRPFRLMARALLSEAIGRVQGAPLRAQAFFAANTARALLATGRRGLAEAALARADDLMAQVDPHEEGASLIRSFLIEIRGDLLRHMKRYAEATALAQTHEPPAADASLEERLHHQRLLGRQALGLKRAGQYLRAIEAFSACVAGLEALEAEAQASTEQLVRAYIPAIRSSLSGALANWSSSYVELTNELEVARAGGGGGGAAEDVSTPELDPVQLRRQALPLLQRALDISVGDNDLRFASIQAHRMGILQGALDNPVESRAWMQRACEFAEAAGDFERLVHASDALALFGLPERNGAEVLKQAERAAHALLRWLVAEGQNVAKPSLIERISAFALLAADLGADAARAIMVAESLKAVRTSLGLRRQLPGRLAEPQHERLQCLLRQREQLAMDLDAALEEESAAILAKLTETQAQLEEVRRERSLRDPVYARWCDVTDIRLSDVAGLRVRLARLGPRTTFLGVYTVSRGLWVYAIWPEGAQVVRVSWDEWPQQLPELLAALHEETGWQEARELLAEKLVAPFHARLESLSREDRLILSFAPPFHLVPFGALPLQDEPLCARMTLSWVQGLGVLEACAETPQTPIRSVLCVGVPARPGLGKLPHARLEVMDIARTFQEAGGSATVLLDNEATVPAVLTQAHAHDVLHLERRTG